MLSLNQTGSPVIVLPRSTYPVQYGMIPEFKIVPMSWVHLMTGQWKLLDRTFLPELSGLYRVLIYRSPSGSGKDVGSSSGLGSPTSSTRARFPGLDVLNPRTTQITQGIHDLKRAAENLDWNLMSRCAHHIQIGVSELITLFKPVKVRLRYYVLCFLYQENINDRIIHHRILAFPFGLATENEEERRFSGVWSHLITTDGARVPPLY